MHHDEAWLRRVAHDILVGGIDDALVHTEGPRHIISQFMRPGLRYQGNRSQEDYVSIAENAFLQGVTLSSAVTDYAVESIKNGGASFSEQSLSDQWRKDFHYMDPPYVSTIVACEAISWLAQAGCIRTITLNLDEFDAQPAASYHPLTGGKPRNSELVQITGYAKLAHDLLNMQRGAEASLVKEKQTRKQAWGSTTRQKMLSRKKYVLQFYINEKWRVPIATLYRTPLHDTPSKVLEMFLPFIKMANDATPNGVDALVIDAWFTGIDVAKLIGENAASFAIIAPSPTSANGKTSHPRGEQTQWQKAKLRKGLMTGYDIQSKAWEHGHLIPVGEGKLAGVVYAKPYIEAEKALFNVIKFRPTRKFLPGEQAQFIGPLKNMAATTLITRGPRDFQSDPSEELTESQIRQLCDWTFDNFDQRYPGAEHGIKQLMKHYQHAASNGAKRLRMLRYAHTCIRLTTVLFKMMVQEHDSAVDAASVLVQEDDRIPHKPVFTVSGMVHNHRQNSVFLSRLAGIVKHPGALKAYLSYLERHRGGAIVVST